MALILASPLFCNAQQPEDVYRKPLKAVLVNVEEIFHVKLSYDDKLVQNLYVDYATWRFSSELSSTLSNILGPLGLGYREQGNNNYYITTYEYYRRTEEEGRRHLNELLKYYTDAAGFTERKKELKKCILKTLGIERPDKKTALNPIITSKLILDGYTVKNAAFESFPGYFVTGTLYTPGKGKGLFPVILSPHGHFYGDSSGRDGAGRYRSDMQYRCAALAKMGAIVFNYDMYSWGESTEQTGNSSFHETSFSLAIQTWNSIRGLDFLLSLPNADKTRVGVTGASGGGTQAILVSALDGRVTASVPVVMVSSCFYGGCPCESGLPIHDVCNHHKTNNTEIAAMFAPLPQLIISDGSDWTKSVPETDYPYLKKVYGFYGKESNIENVHLPNDQHDYGYTKRVPMYKFFAKIFGLNLKAVTGKDGNIDEHGCTMQKSIDMLVFGKGAGLPPNALRSHKDIETAFRNFQSSN